MSVYADKIAHYSNFPEPRPRWAIRDALGLDLFKIEFENGKIIREIAFVTGNWIANSIRIKNVKESET